MNEFGLVFDHLGLAVRAPDYALKFLLAGGYSASPPIYDSEQNVNLIMCSSLEMPNVEIIFPGSGEGPIDNILSKIDAGMYHMCFRAEDPQASVERMSSQGLRVFCLVEPKPAVLFGGSNVSFYNVAGFGVIELIEGLCDRVQ
jgi:hypothetical protein